MKRLFCALCLVLPLVVNSAPAIILGTSGANPGEVAQIDIDYDGNGSGVTDFVVEVAIDATLFRDITGLCPGTVFSCHPSSRNSLIITGDSQDGSEIPSGQVGRLALEVAPTTAPGNYMLPIVSEAYFDSKGAQVGGSGSNDGLLVVNQAPVAVRQKLSRSGDGGVLVFPYYTTRSGADSLFALRNNSPMMKALRVNISEGWNGRIIGSWNAYLPPGAVHRFQLEGDSQTGGVVARADGCTVPEIPASGIPMNDLAYVSDAGPKGPDRMREGTVHVIAMADIDPAVAMTFADCSVAQARFESTGIWTNNPLADTSAPIGDIAGRASVRGVRQLPAFDFVPTGIRGYAGMSLHRSPGDFLGFNEGNAAAQITDGGGTVLTTTFNNSVDAMSALLMKEQTVLPLRQRGTIWQFTFPTKPYYTDFELAPVTPPVPPFTSFFDSGGACESVEILPLRVGALRPMCYVTNVQPFDSFDVFNTRLGTLPVSFSQSLIGGVAQFSGNGLTNTGGDIQLDGLPVIGTSIPYRLDRAPNIKRLELPLGTGAKGMGSPSAGESVMVKGRLVFVGVPGANGGQGQVLVYRRHGTRLVLETAIDPPVGTVASELGAAMDFVDGRLAVGAPGDTTALAKGGLPALQGMIMERLEGVWNVKGTVTDAAPSDAQFGASVAIENGLVAFGAPGDDTVGNDAGAVFLFDDSGNSVSPIWPTTAGFDATAGLFGLSLTMKNGQMGVGSPGAGGVQGAFTGAVSMFGDIANNLNPTTVQVGSSAGDGFGSSISLSESMMAVGSPGADGEAGSAQGSVQTFQVVGGNLVSDQLIINNSVGAAGNFGAALFLGGDQLIVGSPGALGTGGVTGVLHVMPQILEAQALFIEATQLSPADETIEGFGSSVGFEPEDGFIVVGAPDSESDLGAVVTVADAEVLFFDDYESGLFR